MDVSDPSPLGHALLKILKPLANFLLRNGVAYAEFAEIARRAYVQTALENFSLEGRKPTISRAAVVTGLTRKEVSRLMATNQSPDDGAARTYNRAARVVSGWVRDPAFQHADGEPATLPLDDSQATPGFSELVRRYSGDMPARAVLDELLRTGVVAEVGDRQLQLLQRAYIPAGDDAQSMHIVGTNVGDLLETLNHNLSCQGLMPRFQRTVTYDNVPVEAMVEWREIAARHSQALLESLDRILSRFDRDASGRSMGSGRMRTGVGVFYFESPVAPS